MTTNASPANDEALGGNTPSPSVSPAAHIDTSNATRYLTIPAETEWMTLANAAQAYATAGWYVLPIGDGDAKHAGSLLGTGWPEKSSRDPELIERWFTHRRARGLALHVGRSGALAFDVDDPQHLPSLLDEQLAVAPFQSTRTDQPGRGHYVFALPDGVMFGNGLGSLKTEPKWGEVRGRNGIIVVAPTPRETGRYLWLRTGAAPELPMVLGQALTRPTAAPRQPTPVIWAYGKAKGLLDKLLSAQLGECNTLLFWASCRFGEMVADGVIDEQMARDALTLAALELGMDVDLATGGRSTDYIGTIDSGLSTGRWAA